MKKLNTEEFVRRSEILHDFVYDYGKSVYINNDSLIIIGCKKHGDFEQEARNHLNGHGCFKCKNKYLTNEEFILKANLIHNNRFSYDESIFNGMSKPIIIKCEKHGYFKQLPKVHLNGHGCAKCSNGVYTKTEIIDLCNEVHNSKYKYNDFEFNERMNKTPLEIYCPKHGKFVQTLCNHIHQTTGCPRCNESKGEKLINNLLTDIGIIFIREKKFNGCKNKTLLRFDFYLSEKKICIEFDGIQHYEPIYGLDKFERLKNNDEIKNKFCDENNILLIRIKYDENITEKILELI